MKTSADRSKRWFWAWLVEMTVAKSRARSPSAQTEVWKNLVLIQAKDVDEAFEKAWKIGRSESGDSRGSLRLNGEAAITQFLGGRRYGLALR